MANEKATIQDLAERLAERNHCSRSRADMFLRKMFNQIKSGLATDSFVKVKGLGTFKLVTTGSRTSVDVNTGEKIEISEHQRLVFTPDNSLKERVNKPFEKFETIKIEDDDMASDLDLTDDEYKGPEAEQNQVEESETSGEQPTIDEIGPAPAEQPQNEAEEIPLDTNLKESDSKTQDNSSLECKTVYIGEHREEHPESQKATAQSDMTENTEPEKENSDIDTDQTDEAETDKEDDAENEDEKAKNNWSLLYIPLAVMGISASMIACYLAGYYHLFDSKSTADIEEMIPACSVSVTEAARPAITATRDTMAAKANETENKKNDPFEQSKQYEQLENGDYLITGTLTVHKLKVGDTLLKLSKKAYGSSKLVQYIVFYNQLENPDCIQLGMELKIPRLVDKTNGKEPGLSKET